VPSFVYINRLISIIYNSFFFITYPFFRLFIPSDTRCCRSIKILSLYASHSPRPNETLSNPLCFSTPKILKTPPPPPCSINTKLFTNTDGLNPLLLPGAGKYLSANYLKPMTWLYSSNNDKPLHAINIFFNDILNENIVYCFIFLPLSGFVLPPWVIFYIIPIF